ncbi:hypothetical protein GCM10023083_29110 [Streptomyces phyllanthi]
MTGLTELRHAQGHLLTLKEMRYADTARIDHLAADAEADLAFFGRRAVAHLAREDAFADHQTDIEQLVADAEAITTVAEAAPVAARLDELADGLRTVTEVVAGLDIGDATVRTSILERIAEVLGGVNRARATSAPGPGAGARPSLLAGAVELDVLVHEKVHVSALPADEPPRRLVRPRQLQELQADAVEHHVPLPEQITAADLTGDPDIPDRSPNRLARHGGSPPRAVHRYPEEDRCSCW